MNRLIVNFVWRGKKPKIKSDTLIDSKGQGGLDLPEYETFSKSLQCAWVRRMQEGVGNQWMTIPSFYLGKVGGPFLFDCNYDINLLNLNTKPAFYIDDLKSWADAQVMKNSARTPALGRLLLIFTVLLRPFQTNGNVLLLGWTLISVSRS